MKKQIVAMILCALVSAGQAERVTKAAKEENPIAKISHDAGYCSVFQHWGFIGDSMSSGELESRTKEGQPGYHDMYEYSWGQRMCAAMGTEGENYSQGGETTFGWIEHFWDAPNNNNHHIDAKAHPKQAYIMALGENDQNVKFEVGDVKTDIDLNDFNKNARTFAGCYAGIIQRVRSIQPDAYFFVVTMPHRPGNREPYNDVIRQMAQVFPHVYIIDLDKFAPDYEAPDFQQRFFVGGHLNVAGYQWTAWMFLTYINWIIEHNWQDFTQAGFVGTPYRYE